MKINYIKKWGNDGTVYTQTIKIDKWLMEEFNKNLKKVKNKIRRNFKKNHYYTNLDMKYIDLEELKNGVNFTNLNHLSLFLGTINILNKKGYNLDFKRILWRNTIIEVI